MAIIDRFKSNKFSKAQTLVEFALVMPVLMLVIYGLLETGRLVYLNTTVISAAREAARFGSASGAVGGTTQYKNCDGIRNAAMRVDALGAIRPEHIAIEYDSGPGTAIKYNDCSSGVVLSSGDRIIVTVQAEYVPFVGLVPFVSRTFALNPPGPLSSTNIRTILGKVKVEGAVAALPPGLTVSVTGGGYVDSDDGKISHCTGTCGGDYDLADATVVTLTATPTGAAAFLGWGGDCAGFGTELVCQVVMNEDRGVTAVFSSTHKNLTVAAVGPGYVTGDAAPQIDCGTARTACNKNYPNDTTVKLTANPEAGMIVHWGGACSGTENTCTLLMDTNHFVSANFGPPGFKLTLLFPNVGMGKVASEPPNLGGGSGICTGECEAYFDADSTIILTATPDPGSKFLGWIDNGCTGTDPCSLLMDSDKTVTVNFDTLQKLLTVTKTGYGFGTVTSTVTPGINCGATCTHLFDTGTTVTLNAVAQAGSLFTGWGGSCSGMTCTLTMNAIKTVTANFDDTTLKTLVLTKAGTGVGMVTSLSVPSGLPNPIVCGSICTAAFASSTVVKLTASNDSNNEFKGWGGACSGAAVDCFVTMDAAKAVTATFDKKVLPPCTFTQNTPVWNNSAKTITWTISNTAAGTAPAVDHYFVIWDGGNLTLISIDGSSIWGPGDQEPVGLTIAGAGRTLNTGNHTMVFTYPNPTSIKGYNFNATIFFVPSNCLPITTGSWRVQ